MLRLLYWFKADINSTNITMFSTLQQDHNKNTVRQRVRFGKHAEIQKEHIERDLGQIQINFSGFQRIQKAAKVHQPLLFHCLIQNDAFFLSYFSSTLTLIVLILCHHHRCLMFLMRRSLNQNLNQIALNAEIKLRKLS